MPVTGGAVTGRSRVRLVNEISSTRAVRAWPQGLSELNIVPIERQFDALANEVAARIIDETAPILATLDDQQITLGIVLVSSKRVGRLVIRTEPE